MYLLYLLMGTKTFCLVLEEYWGLKVKVLKSHWIKRAVRTLLHLALDIFSIFFSVFYISGSSWLYGILSDTGRMCIRSNYCKVRPKSVIEMVVLHVYSIRCTCIINMCQDNIYHKVTTRSGTALWHSGYTVWPIFYIFFLSILLLSVLRGHSVFSSTPQGPMTSDFEGFSYQIVSITFLSHHNSWEIICLI